MIWEENIGDAMFNDYLAREYGISILEVKSYLEIGRRYSLIYTEMYSGT